METMLNSNNIDDDSQELEHLFNPNFMPTSQDQLFQTGIFQNIEDLLPQHNLMREDPPFPPPLEHVPEVPAGSFQPFVYRAPDDPTPMPIYQSANDIYVFNSEHSKRTFTDFYMKIEAVDSVEGSSNKSKRSITALISNVAHVIPEGSNEGRRILNATIAHCSQWKQDLKNKLSSKESANAFKVSPDNLTDEQKKLKRITKNATPTTWCTLEWLASLTGSRKVRICILDLEFGKANSTFLWVPYDSRYVKLASSFRMKTLRRQMPLLFPSEQELNWNGNHQRKIVSRQANFKNDIWKPILKNRYLSDDPIENRKWITMSTEMMLFTPFSLDLSENKFQIQELLGDQLFETFRKNNPIRTPFNAGGAPNPLHFEDQELKRRRQSLIQSLSAMQAALTDYEPFPKRARYSQIEDQSTVYSTANVHLGYNSSIEYYNPGVNAYSPVGMINGPKKPKKKISNNNFNLGLGPIQTPKSASASITSLETFKSTLIENNPLKPPTNPGEPPSRTRGRPTSAWSFLKKLIGGIDKYEEKPDKPDKFATKQLWVDYVHEYMEQEYQQFAVYQSHDPRGYQFDWKKLTNHLLDRKKSPSCLVKAVEKWKIRDCFG